MSGWIVELRDISDASVTIELRASTGLENEWTTSEGGAFSITGGPFTSTSTQIVARDTGSTPVFVLDQFDIDGASVGLSGAGYKNNTVGNMKNGELTWTIKAALPN